MNPTLKHILVDAEFVFQSLANNSNDYVYVWDIESGGYLTSDTMAEAFDIACEGDDFYHAWGKVVHTRDLERLNLAFTQAMDTHKTKINIEYQAMNTQGEYVWVNERSTIRYNEVTKKADMMIGILHNLTQDGRVDNVTGLLKYEKCKALFDINKDGLIDGIGSVMLLGMDDFTNINTMNNHIFGDFVLRKTVHDILGLLDENTFMYRFDGDQFLVLAEGLEKAGMLKLYEKIQEYQSVAHEMNGQKYRFTISAGIASYPEDGNTWSEIEKAISMTLKKAKEKGKNRYECFTKIMFEEKIYEQTLNYHLADAINHDFKGFHMVYQPVCYTQDLKVKGAEALLRFTTPSKEIISPEEFIPLLEQSQQILVVGAWVLEEAIKTCKEWTKQHSDFVMNVNVSYLQLRDSRFCDIVESLLAKYHLDPRHLTLELTESYFITDAENIDASMKRLQSLKLQMAMDDFGTGYSSLARLSQFNVDVVKIDRSFVQSLNSSNYNREFVESVIRLCHKVGMKVCVEGIETKEEQASVCVLNADYIQGFYVSRPLMKEAFYEHFIKNPNANEQLVVVPDLHLRHDQLRGDKDTLLAMMDASPMSLNFWSRDFEILACNDVVLRLFEVANYDEFKDNFYTFSPEYQPNGKSSKEYAKEIITRAYDGERLELIWEHCLANGDSLPMELTLVRIPYMDDYLVASFTRDMRAQQEMEMQIKKFNQRLKAILDATPLCLNLWNKKFENIMCNKEAVSLFELQSEQEYTDHFFELSPKYQPSGIASDEAAIQYIEQAFTQERVQFFWMHCNLKGEMIPAEITLIRIDGLGENGEDLVAGFTRDIRFDSNLKDVLNKTKG